jgi:tetratricopeptide (TPR) repeat protein
MQEVPSMTTQQLMLQAEQLQAQGQLAEAERLYRQIINATQDFHPAYHSLGLLAQNVGKHALAVDLISHAITLEGTVALYHSNLCEILRRLGRLDEAIEAGKRAIRLNPNNVNALYNLGLALADSKDWDAAVENYQRVLELNPEHGLASNNLGAAFEKMGKMDEAEKAYARAVAIDPRHAEAQNNLGAIYSERGDLDEARQCFSAAIEAKQDFSEAHYNLSSLKTYTQDDPHLQALEALADHAERLPPDSQIRFNFAMGKALEDVGVYDRAFTAYERGNQLKFAGLTYNEARAEAVFERIKYLFDSELFATRPDSGIADETPVFIVGMPRSGTTLIEQILASHDDVFGAGELKDLHEVITSSGPAALEGRFFEECQPGLAEFDLKEMANNYLQRLREKDHQALRVTDKMPANFFYTGFICLILPRAKIIHAMRDPMDSCFSCYSRLFNETMDFTYDLQTLGNYYVRYIKLMEYWHKVLPAGSILDVRYEDMVADVEGQTRAMLNHVNLPWSDDCLEFYNNKRHIKTASVAQVRKPIYNTSIARWKHFSKHLDPLREIVEQYRDPWIAE